MLPLLLVLAAFAGGAAGSPAAARNDPDGNDADGNTTDWDARRCEHLLNRAGFGASPEEVAAGVELGRDALVERLLAARRAPLPALEEPLAEDVPAPPDGRMPWTPTFGAEPIADPAEELRRAWVRGLVAGTEPARDRLTLFWSRRLSAGERPGPRTDARRLAALRPHALAPFGELVRAAARAEVPDDAAPPVPAGGAAVRELLARGLPELGVVPAADAASFEPGRLLGMRGLFDEELARATALGDERAARALAGALLEHLEGRAPSPERLQHYAALLGERELDVAPLLRRLLADPAFYRDEVVGTRTATPLARVVGAARRLELRAPAGLLLAVAERLERAPDRSAETVGALVGRYPGRGRWLEGDRAGLARFAAAGWAPDLRPLRDALAEAAGGVSVPEEAALHALLDRALGVPVTDEALAATRARLDEFTETAAGSPEGSSDGAPAPWLEDLAPDGVLARLVHVALALPEAGRD